MSVPEANVKIAIVGAGSGYMPGVIRGLLHRAGDLAGAELAFYDPDAAGLELMTRLATRMFAARGAAFTVTAHTDLKPALSGAAYVFTTFRPGGMEARRLDEAIPLAHGVVGQETAGPGGFMMACRSVPVLLEIAAHAEPDAWIVNYTNPTNIVTDAVTRNTGVRVIGLCDQFVGDTEMWAGLLGLPHERLEVDWIGLNHATWAERVRLDGRELDLPALLADLEIPGGGATPWRDPSRMAELAKALGFLPNSYSKYYFFHDEVVAELRAKGTTRAEDIQAMLPGFVAQVTEESFKDDPDPSRERGGGEHGEFAIDVICTLHLNESRRVIVNTVNGGAISSLPADAIVEVPSLLTAAGPVPLTMGPIPRAVRGLTQAVHEYERLASDAAVSGSRRLALQALMAHPFVPGKHTAEKILDEGLAAHRAYLPQFG
ncbi:glycoside hydrolase family 4 [Spirillospora sp. NPDC047279]|uniref:family 4 glycosyl hydrolase n=1 Tax=Spirillospora sp. NPDC047279 TaxID=3155478 RepID=UPI0033EB7747